MPCNGMFLEMSVGRHYTVNCLIMQMFEQKDIPAQTVLKKMRSAKNTSAW